MHPALDPCRTGLGPAARYWIMAQTWHDLLFAHWPVEANSSDSTGTGSASALILSLAAAGWEWSISHERIRARNLPPIAGLSRSRNSMSAGKLAASRLKSRPLACVEGHVGADMEFREPGNQASNRRQDFRRAVPLM